MFLVDVSLRESAPEEGFPFDLPIVRHFRGLELTAPVTLLVGENGGGKSTFLEALAYASERVTVGSEAVERDLTLAHVRALGDALRLSWTQRTKRGFFMRAEDFFGYIKAQNTMKKELEGELRRLRRERPRLPGGEARRISAPYAGSVAATERRYGRDLDANSHGESFLAFFKGRLTGAGLYLLDEPEAALSPLRQLDFLSMIKEATERGAQFIMATHAPILMACPGAQVLELRENRLTPTRFDALEHVKLMRDFLNAPDAFTRHL